MMDAEYLSKKMTAQAAVAGIPSGCHIAMGMAVAEPPALLAALAERVEAGDLDDLKLWYFHSVEHAGRTLLRRELLDRVRPHCMFLSAIERELIRREAEGRSPIEFVPTAFSESSRLLSERVPLEAFIITVSPMDRHGWFTFGTSNDYATTAARSAKRLIVEVNPNMPRVFGESMLHLSEVDAIVEHDAPLPEFRFPESEPEDESIADMIAAMIDDGSCLQMGIGTLPNAVCAKLEATGISASIPN
jgi:itaconate CoA-transferase